MSSSCFIPRSDLGRLRDGVLAASETERLAVHVEGCVRCRGLLADLALVGELLVAQRAELADGLPSDFAARVMASLPAARPAWSERWAELVRKHRDALVISLLGAAVAASLLVVFAPGLRSPGDHVQEAAENEAQIHQLTVTGADQNAVVLQSAEGNTVIWLVTPGEDDDAGSASPGSP